MDRRVQLCTRLTGLSSPVLVLCGVAFGSEIRRTFRDVGEDPGVSTSYVVDRTGQNGRYAEPMDRVLTPRGAATRQRIVEAAAGLIRERGVAETGLDDIGAATATSKSQMFHYFPGGKADLLVAVATHEAGQVIADQQPYLGDLTTWRKWQAWRRRVIQKYDDQRDRCPMTALTSHMGKATPATREIVSSLYDTWTQHLATGVQALKDSGEIDANTDVNATATSVLAAIQGGVLMMQATDSISYLETALDEALDAMRRSPHIPKAKPRAQTKRSQKRLKD
jgi:AcrR family transcriptional regulator